MLVFFLLALDQIQIMQFCTLIYHMKPSPAFLFNPYMIQHIPASANLWSTDIKVAQKYITLVQQGFHAKNIHEQIAILVSCHNQTGKCTLDDEHILNKIDKAITGIMLCAEVECKKARGYSWSPLLTNAGCTVIAAKWHLSTVLNNQLQIRLLDQAHAIIQAKKQLKEAYAVLQTIQKNAK